MGEEGSSFLIEAGSGILNTLLQETLNKNLMQEQQKYQEQNMSTQHQYNKEYMQLQHDYQSPLQQRKDLEAAGFNASLMLKDNPNMGISQPSAPNGAMPTVGDIPSLLQSMLMAEELKGKKIQNDYAPSLNEAQLGKLREDTKKIATDRNFTAEQLKIIEVTEPFVVGKSFQDWQASIEFVSKLEAETTKTLKESELVETEGAIAKHHLDFEQFRTKWRKETGLDYNDDNVYGVLYGLYKTGKLKETFEAIGDGLKNILEGGNDSDPVGKQFLDHLDYKGKAALDALPDYVKNLLHAAGIDWNSGSVSGSF